MRQIQASIHCNVREQVAGVTTIERAVVHPILDEKLRAARLVDGSVDERTAGHVPRSGCRIQFKRASAEIDRTAEIHDAAGSVDRPQDIRRHELVNPQGPVADVDCALVDKHRMVITEADVDIASCRIDVDRSQVLQATGTRIVIGPSRNPPALATNLNVFPESQRH